MLRLALRPKWVGLLLLALAIASAFAWLGSWQLARSRANATPLVIQAAKPVGEVVQPQQSLPELAATTPIIVTGLLQGSEAAVVDGRRSNGTPVRWLLAPVEVPTAQGGTTQPARMPVVLGSFAAKGPVPAVPTRQVRVQGLIQPSEDPSPPEADGTLTAVSSADLVNRWGQPIYAGFLFADPDTARLAGVDPVPPPTLPTSTGFAILNLSYAVQWWIFAAVACFIWWRLLRDEFNALNLDESALAGDAQPGPANSLASSGPGNPAGPPDDPASRVEEKVQQ